MAPAGERVGGRAGLLPTLQPHAAFARPDSGPSLGREGRWIFYPAYLGQLPQKSTTRIIGR